MFWTGSLIIAVDVAVALGFLGLVRWRVPAKKLKGTNDIVGYYTTIIGTIYAVILAFMLSGVWARFEDAKINTQREANAVVDIFRVAEGLPQPTQSRLQGICRNYAVVMVTEEWPAMLHKGISPASERLLSDYWQTVAQFRPRTVSEQIMLNQTVTALNAMMEYRRLRHLQNRDKLPGILWAVLIAGGIITVAVSCLFGVDDPRLHFFKVAALTFTISLVLVAIAEIDEPFQGNVRVGPDGFQYALQTFSRITAR